MYVTTPYNTAMAYDLDTGKQVWRYEHKLGTTIFCCGPNNRGVAVHGPHVYMGTLDARLIALDRMTGEVVWDIEVADPAFGYSITARPARHRRQRDRRRLGRRVRHPRATSPPTTR